MATNTSYDKTLAAWNAVAERYEAKFMGLPHYHAAYAAFFNLLPESARVLEIGAGPGIVTAYATQHFPKVQLLVTDAAKAMVQRSQFNFPQHQHQVLRAEEIATLNETFDGLVAAFCINYMPEAAVRELFIAATKKLHHSGALYISFMEGAYAESGMGRGSTGHEMLVHYYPETTICSWLKAAGFHITERLDLPPGDLTPRRQCMLISIKQVQPSGCSIT